MNEDDYGMVLPPEDFTFGNRNPTIPTVHFTACRVGPIISAISWPAFRSTSIPMDALAEQYMVLLNRLREICYWPPEFDYAELKPDQQRCGIISGIGNDAHFAPAYGIGLELGWGRSAG